jgi:plasmid stabilization system protein ParE
VAYRVVWSPRLPAFEAIAAYIALDSTTYAKAVVRTIVRSTRTLARFPRAGRKVPEFDDENTRELMAYSYRIIYAVELNQVTISAINHGKRML